MKKEKTLNFSFIIINISIVILFLLAITLPYIITWFVEIKHKDAGLPAVVMLTCYPCFPFAVVALFKLRKFIKNCINGLIFGDQNISLLKSVALCCVGGAAITFVAGYFYLPFYVICLASLGCALIIKVIKDVFSAELYSRREKLLEDMRDTL